MLKKQLLSAFALMTSVLVTAQSGQKWATGLNSLSNGDALGSSNNMPLIFKTNNTQHMSIGANGVLQVNGLAGTGTRFLQTDASGNLLSFPIGNATQVLFGDGTWGNVPSQYWQSLSDGVISPMSTTTKVGIGNTSPQYNLDVTGNVHISQDLIVNNGITLGSRNLLIKSGANGELLVLGPAIFSGGATVNGLVNIGSMTNSALAGTGFTILYTDANGLFNILPASTNPKPQFLSSNGQWVDLPPQQQTYWGKAGGGSIYYNAGTIGIGTSTPNSAYALDVTGDANVSGNLYLGGDVFISPQQRGTPLPTKYSAKALMINAAELRTRTLHADTISMDSLALIKGITTFDSKVRLRNGLNVAGNSIFAGSVDVSSITSNGQSFINFQPGFRGEGGFRLPSQLNLTTNTNVHGNLNISSLGGVSGGGFVSVDSTGNLKVFPVDPVTGEIQHCVTQIPWMIGGNNLGHISNAIIGTCDLHDFVLQSNGVPHLWIKPSGKFGMGNGNPVAQLDLTVSDTVNTGFNINNSGGSVFSVSNNGNTLIKGNLIVSTMTNTAAGTYHSLLVDANGKLASGGVASPLSTGWNLGGNNNSGGSTLGTLDNSDLILVAGGQGLQGTGVERMRIVGQGAAIGSLAMVTGNQILLKNTDTNHGLGYYDGSGSTTVSGFAGKTIDGPVLYGWSGGALGTINGGVSSQLIALQWNNSGQVFIGARRPNSSNPHLNASLAVSGDIVTTAIYVTNPANTWSDFVFDKDYKVMKLDELEKFYKTNHHLPDVPTTKDIQENGNDLAKTDAILLQKIEELTLYLVAQNKAMEKLKTENEEFKKALQKLISK